jgi:glutamine amidotransferase
VLDFGMGNLRSVVRALERAGARPCVTRDPEVVRTADRLVMPGVGALGDCMRSLGEQGNDAALRERLRAGRPYLGICLGLEVLFEWGQEGPSHALGLLPGRIERFPDALGVRVPHMGWNEVRPERPHPVVSRGYFYFVHSYRAVSVPATVVAATTEYGEAFAAAVAFDGAVAVQFHPEKSQAAGLGLLERFLAWRP